MSAHLRRYAVRVFDGVSKFSDTEIFSYSWQDAFDEARAKYGGRVSAHDVRAEPTPGQDDAGAEP